MVNEFRSPFIKNDSPTVGTLYKPYVYLAVANPASNAGMIVSAYVDTGADFNHISKKLADELGLAPTSGKAIDTSIADQTKIKVVPTSASYQLVDERQQVVTAFPVQTTEFYIADPGAYHVVLGLNGFFDRFESVTFEYPDVMIFRWT
jgi:predicted aspartyl protease